MACNYSAIVSITSYSKCQVGAYVYAALRNLKSEFYSMIHGKNYSVFQFTHDLPDKLYHLLDAK